jgi:Tfp pilus assembly protein PilF
MSRIEKLLAFIESSGKDSFLQHALALEYIKIGDDEKARNLFNELLLREPTYVGSYYHLGKLLERVGDLEKAIRIYQRGMEEAKRAGDQHALNELRGALEDIEDEAVN